jgi:hypothetical protein
VSGGVRANRYRLAFGEPRHSMCVDRVLHFIDVRAQFGGAHDMRV